MYLNSFVVGLKKEPRFKQEREIEKKNQVSFMSVSFIHSLIHVQKDTYLSSINCQQNIYFFITL